VQEKESFRLLPLMGYNLVLIHNDHPTLKKLRTHRLTRRYELVGLIWGRQWPKSGGVIFLTPMRFEAVAKTIYDHSFTGAKIGG